MNEGLPATGADLWAFCNRLYREPGVESLCLDLQDKQNANVLVLLWCGWLEARGLTISHRQLASVSHSISYKSRSAIMPLRQLRRHLKEDTTVPEGVRQEARSHIQRAELVLEKQLLRELEALSAQVLDSGREGLKPLDVLIQVQGLQFECVGLSELRSAVRRVLRGAE